MEDQLCAPGLEFRDGELQCRPYHSAKTPSGVSYSRSPLLRSAGIVAAGRKVTDTFTIDGSGGWKRLYRQDDE